MTKIKLCGLSCPRDIETANALRPDYIGFVFYPKSKRNVTADRAALLRQCLSPDIQAVGVFVNEPPEAIAALLRSGVIDIAQLHGDEDEAYLTALRGLTDKPLIKAFRVRTEADCAAADACSADYVLLDSGMGSGAAFDWTFLSPVHRPYFLAGGLHVSNVTAAIRTLHPFAVDVSSGIETNGCKDSDKMAAFVAAVRKEDFQ